MVASSNVNVRSLITRILVIAVGAIVLWILYSSYNTHFNSGLAKGQKVNVTVFYEVLCPDSRHFILRQLQPTWEKVSEIMDINYRPFGKAHYRMVDGEYEFQCQHGATECLGNMVHNCAVKYVKEPLPYITCMMENNWEPLAIGKKCADMLDLNWGEIERCANSGEGKDLLAESGAQSLIVKPHLSFIPTVALNGDFSGQNLRLKNLLSTVCNAYNGQRPENCIQVI